MDKIKENLALQAVALGLGTVVVGAFRDREVAAVAALDTDERPLAILPVGSARAEARAPVRQCGRPKR